MRRFFAGDGLFWTVVVASLTLLVYLAAVLLVGVTSQASPDLPPVAAGAVGATATATLLVRAHLRAAVAHAGTPAGAVARVKAELAARASGSEELVDDALLLLSVVDHAGGSAAAADALARAEAARFALPAPRFTLADPADAPAPAGPVPAAR